MRRIFVSHDLLDWNWRGCQHERLTSPQDWQSAPPTGGAYHQGSCSIKVMNRGIEISSNKWDAPLDIMKLQNSAELLNLETRLLRQVREIQWFKWNRISGALLSTPVKKH
jgi:hypothetical protein